ncbi:MAG: BTAD domain-containing putative transcriptional regulator, partial [Anaerolineales bacterium]
GLGSLLIDLDQLEEARRYLNEALKLGSQTGETRELRLIHLSLAALERLNGRFNEALNWLRKSGEATKGATNSIDYALELGNIYAAMEQRELALEQFETTLTPEKTVEGLSQSQVLAAFAAARMHFYLGRESEVWGRLELCLKGAAKLGYDHFLVISAYRNQDFIDHLAKNNPSAQLQNLISRASQFQPGEELLEPETIVEKVPDVHIQVQAFGHVQVRRNGELLPSTIWTSNRARALFFYLLLHEKAGKETIGLDFWPDFSPGKVSSNFHSTLWRLRQALGFRDAIVFEEEQYKFHPSITVWYDVAEFQNYVRQARSEKLSRAARSELLQQAITLYQGPYLPDVYMDWADQYRDELRNTYLEALASLASIEAKNKRFGESRKLYEKIVSVDPYRDAIHLELMKCLTLMGSPSAALAHYKRYKALLRKELNVEPLPELQEYFEQLAVKA